MGTIVLNEKIINELFPFHFNIDNSLTIINAGDSLKKLCPDILNSQFVDYFKFNRPAFGIKYDFESILTYKDQVFIFDLKTQNGPIRMRGQILNVNNTLFFAGSPWLVSTDDFEKYKLLIRDFAISDPVTDMVQLLQVRQLAFNDIESLANSLKEQRDLLLNKNIEIEDLAKFPAENPNPIFRIALSGFLRYMNPTAERIFRHINLKRGDIIPDLLKTTFTNTLNSESKCEMFFNINDRIYNFLFVPFIDSGYVNIYGTDITEEKKAEALVIENDKRLRVQYGIVELLSTSTLTTENTIERIIEIFCQHTEWNCGSYWEVNPSIHNMQCKSYWQSNNIVNKEFENTTRSLKFSKGEGLPGRVWQSNEYAWVPNVIQDLNFPRAVVAKKVGLHGAFAYPIFFNNDLLGVIEFFSTQINEPNSGFIELVEASSMQIGQYIIRKKNEEFIRESEEKYKQLVEEASDIIYRTDYNGNFVYANSIAERIMQMAKEKIIGKNFLELVHPSWREKTATFYFKQFKEKTPMTYFEFPALGQQNKELWLGQNVKLILDKNTIIGFHAVARDVSDRVKAQVELKKNEEKYRGIIENLDLGILEVDNDGIIVKAYQKYCQLTGYSEAELIGKNAFDILLDAEQKKIMQQEAEKRNNGASSVYEIQLNCNNNIKKWVLISGSPIYDENNKVVGSIGIHLDITERKEFEQKLVFAKQAAEHSQKIKEEFLANMSHEIRTPMNGILGMSKLLSAAELSNKNREYLNSIQTSAKNLLVIINDILDLSKIEAGKLTLEKIGFKINHVLKNAIETVNYLAVEKDLFITLNLDENLVDLVVLGDPTRLNQILINLINNAIKFTTKGEIKIVCTSKIINQKNIQIQFQVVDQGIGIPENKLKSIFESFNQADTSTTRKYGGTGLGLSICKTLVELQNGTIAVESIVNKGTTFLFSIPYEIGGEINLPIQENEETMYDFSTLNLLLVEDHKINQVYAMSILENHKINVDIAENGVEAIDILKNKKYDIILMDMQMPIMGGLEATKIIRTQLKISTPIIALTANAIQGESDKCIEAGMNEFISKPFDDKQLINKIGKLLNSEKHVSVHKLNENQYNLDETQILFSTSKLEKMSNGNHAFVDKLVRLFKEETPKSIQALNQHLENMEYEKLKSAAHKMKPSIDMMDIKSIKEDIQKVEDYAGELKNIHELPFLVNKITAVCNKVVSLL